MFDTIHIYVPEMRQIIRIAEGTGDNLLDEDIEAGYVDYIYYDTFVIESDIREHDGGMVMLTELFREKFSNTAEAIPNVLDMAYGSTEFEYIVL
jgi:hypothetical protein